MGRSFALCAAVFFIGGSGVDKILRGWHSLHRRSPYLAVVEEVINHQRLKELLPLHRVDITEKLQRYPMVENHPQQQYRTRETVTLQE